MNFISHLLENKILSFEALENIFKKDKANKNEFIHGTILDQKSIPDSKINNKYCYWKFIFRKIY